MVGPDNFHKDFLTWVEHVEYYWGDHFGRVWAKGPVDMAGSIRFFSKIDSKVGLIEARMNGVRDVCYRKSNGEWEVGDFR
jgi:hypothetical protein